MSLLPPKFKSDYSDAIQLGEKVSSHQAVKPRTVENKKLLTNIEYFKPGDLLLSENGEVVGVYISLHGNSDKKYHISVLTKEKDQRSVISSLVEDISESELISKYESFKIHSRGISLFEAATIVYNRSALHSTLSVNVQANSAGTVDPAESTVQDLNTTSLHDIGRLPPSVQMAYSIDNESQSFTLPKVDEGEWVGKFVIINYDKFVNYSNYYWVGQQLETELPANPNADPEFYVIGRPEFSDLVKMPVDLATTSNIQLYAGNRPPETFTFTFISTTVFTVTSNFSGTVDTDGPVFISPAEGDETLITLVDGVQIAGNERVLVCNQTDPSENGIYMRGNKWQRGADFNTEEYINVGTAIYVKSGSTYSNSTFNVTSVGNGVDPFELDDMAAGQISIDYISNTLSKPVNVWQGYSGY